MTENKTEKIGGSLKYATIFTIKGHGSFGGVLDMMRLDRATPFSSKDSSKIGDIVHEPLKDQEIQMITYHENKKWSPNLGRWKSFGYDVKVA